MNKKIEISIDKGEVQVQIDGGEWKACNHYVSRILTGSLYESGYGIFTATSGETYFWFSKELDLTINFKETWGEVLSRLGDNLPAIKEEIIFRMGLVEAAKAEVIKNSCWNIEYLPSEDGNQDIERTGVIINGGSLLPLDFEFSRYLTSTTDETGHGIFTNKSCRVRFERESTEIVFVDFGSTWEEFLDTLYYVDYPLVAIKTEIIRRAKLVQDAFVTVIPPTASKPTADYLFIEHTDTGDRYVHLYIKASFLERLSSVHGVPLIKVLGESLTVNWGTEDKNRPSLAGYRYITIGLKTLVDKEDFQFLKAILGTVATFGEPATEEPEQLTEPTYSILNV
jgi:hypothetical protein